MIFPALDGARLKTLWCQCMGKGVSRAYNGTPFFRALVIGQCIGNNGLGFNDRIGLRCRGNRVADGQTPRMHLVQNIYNSRVPKCAMVFFFSCM